MANIKKMEKDHLEEMFQLAKYAFHFEETEERRKRFQYIATHSENYGVFQAANQLTSQVMNTPFTVNFHGVTYTMGGIGFVSSYPEWRGQGGINQLMTDILRDSYQKGQVLSYLAPFSYSFYRRYGYEWVFERLTYEMNVTDLPVVERMLGQVIRVTPKEGKTAIQHLYHASEQSKKGGLIRDDWWYTYKYELKEPNSYMALYKNEQGVEEGYLVYEMDSDCLVIKELVYISLEAFYGIIHFIKSHQASFVKCRYETGQNQDTVSFLMPEPSVKRSLTPYMMARIVSMKAFLEQYPWSVSQERLSQLVFRVKDDEYAPWNNGWYEWRLVEGQWQVCQQIQAEEVTPDKLCIEGSIQGFTQMLLGYQKPTTLAFFQQIKGEQRAIQLLDELVVTMPPVLDDYF